MDEKDIKSIREAQKGNKEELGILIEKNNGLIWSIVKRFMGRGYEKEDLYQIGCMGFIKSIKKFNTDYDVKLSTYAVPYILGEIKRFIRDDGPIKVSRSLKELNAKIVETQRQYLNRTGKEMSLKLLSETLKISREDITMAMDSAKPVDSIEESTYRDNKTDSTVSILDKISTGKDEATQISNKLTIKKLIEGLQSKEKEVILLRFYKEKTQMQVAKILGITQVQVSRIERKVLESMKIKLIS